MSDHSLISPSMLHRAFACPGSVLASKDLPDKSSPAAEHGTMLHGMAEEMLRVGFTDASTLSPDDHRLITDYVRYVKEQCPGGKLYVEELVHLDDYVPGMRGSIDALIVGEDEIHCIDLKTGSHPVSAEANLQLMAYALGAVTKFEKYSARIYCHIYQPMNVSKVAFTWEGLQIFAEELRVKAQAALEPNAPRNPSDDACRYCKAAPECPALYEQQLAIVQGDFNDLAAPEKLTDEQIAAVVLNRAKVEKWMKTVNSYALDRANRGEAVTGTKVVEGRAVRKFTNAGREALIDHLGEDAYEKKLIGVTTADSLIGKELVDAMTYKSGSPTLVGLEDKRPAITNAVDDFDVLN